MSAVVSGVPAARFVELRVLVPSSLFDVEPTGGPRLKGVIDEEGAFIGAMTEKPNPLRDIARVVAPILSAVGLLGLGGLWLRFGREKTSTEVMVSTGVSRSTTSRPLRSSRSLAAPCRRVR